MLVISSRSRPSLASSWQHLTDSPPAHPRSSQPPSHRGFGAHRELQHRIHRLYTPPSRPIYPSAVTQPSARPATRLRLHHSLTHGASPVAAAALRERQDVGLPNVLPRPVTSGRSRPDLPCPLPTPLGRLSPASSCLSKAQHFSKPAANFSCRHCCFATSCSTGKADRNGWPRT